MRTGVCGQFYYEITNEPKGIVVISVQAPVFISLRLLSH